MNTKISTTLSIKNCYIWYIMSNIEQIKETKAQRAARIAGTGNGATLRTRLVLDKHKYSRKIKHKGQSIANAMDFAFIVDNLIVNCYIVGHGKNTIRYYEAGRPYQGIRTPVYRSQN